MKYVIFVLLVLISYVLGSIPFGVIIGRSKGKDLTKEGSGNIGTTNATRVLGIVSGLCVGICDILKGTIIIILVHILEHYNVWYNPIVVDGESLYVIYGFAAVIGHCYSCFLNKKGGKAVATSFGVLLVCFPWSSLGAAIIFGITLALWGYVSVSSTSATLTGLIMSWIIYGINDGNYISCIFLTLMAILIVVKHKENYKRLVEGTESCFKKNKGLHHV